MNEELETQDKQLEGLQDHTSKTLGDLKEVESTTRRDFKLRDDAGVSCPSLELMCAPMGCMLHWYSWLVDMAYAQC